MYVSNQCAKPFDLFVRQENFLSTGFLQFVTLVKLGEIVLFMKLEHEEEIYIHKSLEKAMVICFLQLIKFLKNKKKQFIYLLVKLFKHIALIMRKYPD